MAFKHPSFLEIVAEAGIPFLHSQTEDPPLGSYETKRVMAIYHRHNNIDPTKPDHGSVGVSGAVNIWGRFIFPTVIPKPTGCYVRIPKLDRSVIYRLEELRQRELLAAHRARHRSSRVVKSNSRLIDLEGLT